MRRRPVSKFQSYTVQAIADWAQAIHDALSAAVAVYATPSVSLADQQTAIDALNAALQAWGDPGRRGSHAAHEAMLTARFVVEENIRSLIGYVNGIAAGDVNLVLLAGMVPNDLRNPFGVLPAPQNLHSPYSKHTIQAQYRIRWKKVRGAKTYRLYMGADSNVANKVLVATVTQTLAIIESPSLPSGTLQYFWVSAVGTAGEGSLSDICAARNP